MTVAGRSLVGCRRPATIARSRLAAIVLRLASAGAPRGCQMKPAVLLADNDAAVSSLLAEVLVRAGLAVEQVYDGEAAVYRASAGDIAVLVCDIDMPKISGIEVVEALRELPRPPLTLMISGYIDHAVEERLGRLAFVRAILRKPFDLLAFAEAVRSLAADPPPRSGGPL